jgi:hypothetical protein
MEMIGRDPEREGIGEVELVLGRVTGRSTTAKYARYWSCSGDQPFWAKRVA